MRTTTISRRVLEEAERAWKDMNVSGNPDDAAYYQGLYDAYMTVIWMLQQKTRIPKFTVLIVALEVFSEIRRRDLARFTGTIVRSL